MSTSAQTNDLAKTSVGRNGLLTCSGLGVRIGRLEPGPLNAITDVEGVRVGHCTLTDSALPAFQTGVTAILPCEGNVYRRRVVAAAHEINGHSKTIGLSQVKELGELESPIVLTNTFSVAAGFVGVLRYLMDIDPALRSGVQSVNPVVAECNDSFLNDMQALRVTPEHTLQALAEADTGPVRQGAVGAGRGMSLFGLKGGIGSASRTVNLGLTGYTLGVLVLGNFGELGQLKIADAPVGRLLEAEQLDRPQRDLAGSVIVVVATDAPTSDRQLLRILRRVQNGLARTGCATDHGSGEVVIGFATPRAVGAYHRSPTVRAAVLAETPDVMNPLFAAAAEAAEEATLNALINGETVIGRDGHRCEGFPVDRLHELLAKARG